MLHTGDVLYFVQMWTDIKELRTSEWLFEITRIGFVGARKLENREMGEVKINEVCLILYEIFKSTHRTNKLDPHQIETRFIYFLIIHCHTA